MNFPQPNPPSPIAQPGIQRLAFHSIYKKAGSMDRLLAETQTPKPAHTTGQKHMFPPPWESIGYVLEMY